MIVVFGYEGFDVFPASETVLADALALSGSGCISATTNFNPAIRDAPYQHASEPIGLRPKD